MGKKVIVGLSGGVDSSVAAHVLLQQGYDVIGVTMHVWGDVNENAAVSDAKKVAEHLNIPHYVIDFTKEFKENVVNYFINEYLNLESYDYGSLEDYTFSDIAKL